MKWLFVCSIIFVFSYSNAQLSADSITGSWEVKEVIIKGIVDNKVRKKVDDIFLNMVFTFKREGVLAVHSSKKGNTELSELVNTLSNQMWQINSLTNQVRVGSVKNRFSIAEFKVAKKGDEMNLLFSDVPPQFTLRTIKLKNP